MIMAKKVRITLVKSPIGRKPRHVRTVEALGLRKLNHSVEQEANASVMGMVNKISYMLRCEEID